MTEARQDLMARLVGLLVVVTLLLSGCDDDSRETDDPDARADAECLPHLRFDDVVYSGAGYLDARDVDATPIGTGELSACNDEGGASSGPYFPDHPETIRVFSLAGQPRNRVVLIPFADDYEVHLAEGMSDTQRMRILVSIGGR